MFREVEIVHRRSRYVNKKLRNIYDRVEQILFV